MQYSDMHYQFSSLVLLHSTLKCLCVTRGSASNFYILFVFWIFWIFLHLDITSRSFIKFLCNEVMHFWSTHLSPAIHPIEIPAVFQMLFIVCVILIPPTSQCLYCSEDLLIHQEQNLCFCPAYFHCEKLNIIASVSYVYCMMPWKQESYTCIICKI